LKRHPWGPTFAVLIIAILFAANSAGYFLGGAVFYQMHSRTGMVAWGAIFGLFLGAGLGATLFLAQHSRTTRAQEAAG